MTCLGQNERLYRRAIEAAQPLEKFLVPMRGSIPPERSAGVTTTLFLKQVAVSAAVPDMVSARVFKCFQEQAV